MKKRVLCRIICITLAICLGLWGCGKKQKGQAEDKNGERETFPAETTNEPEADYETVDEVNVEENSMTVLELREKQMNTADYSGSIDARSAYLTSYRQLMGEEKEVVYLGMPRTLAAPDENQIWTSSDETVAYIQGNATVVGLREGCVTVSLVERDTNAVLQSCEYVITTYNDGKNAAVCYEFTGELGDKERVNAYDTIRPEVARTLVNTIQDAIAYFQIRRYYQYDSPVLYNDEACWTWANSGDAVLYANGGNGGDMANAAAYLLQYDFEDWGFIFAFGARNYVVNWFYEDGTYYVIHFANIIDDNKKNITREYVPYATDNLKDLAEYVKTQYGDETTLTIVMCSALMNYNQPAYHTNYMHDSSEALNGNAVIGFEQAVYDSMAVLYSNPNYEYTIRSFAIEDIPTGVYTYESNNFMEYHY